MQTDFPVFMGTLVTPAGGVLEAWGRTLADREKFLIAVSDYVDGTPGSPRALFFGENFRLKPVAGSITIPNPAVEAHKAQLRAQLERMEPSKCAGCKGAGWVSASFGNMKPCPLCGPML